MIISATTHAHLTNGELDSLKLRVLQQLTVKGKKEPVTAFAIP